MLANDVWRAFYHDYFFVSSSLFFFVINHIIKQKKTTLVCMGFAGWKKKFGWQLSSMNNYITFISKKITAHVI
jgi:hypothetical protein